MAPGEGRAPAVQVPFPPGTGWTTPFKEAGHVGQLGRWDVPTTIQLITLQGRKVSDDIVQQAQALRRAGFSLRQVAQMLDLSKTGVGRFVVGISPEELQQDLEQPTLSEGDVTQAEEDPTLRNLRETLFTIREFIRACADKGDRAGVRFGLHGKQQTYRMFNSYIQERYPGISPVPVPTFRISQDQTETAEPETNPLVGRVIAAMRQEQEEQNAAFLQDWRKDLDRKWLQLLEEIEKNRENNRCV